MFNRSYSCQVCNNKILYTSFRKRKIVICTKCRHDYKIIGPRWNLAKELYDNNRFRRWFYRQENTINSEIDDLMRVKIYSSAKTRMLMLLIDDIVKVFNTTYKYIEEEDPLVYTETVDYFYDWSLKIYKQSIFTKNLNKVWKRRQYET